MHFILRLVRLLAVTALLGVPALAIGDEFKRIGVLAFKGETEAREHWWPTIDYLSENIPGYRFHLVPVTNDNIELLIRTGVLDFVITNSGSYIALEESQGLTRIATLIRSWDGGEQKRFGAVIFTRADRDDIQSLKDLKDKSFMGVHPNGFGGWWMAWGELKAHGIHPHRDFKRLEFSGFPQVQVLQSVLDGKVDAGTFRSGSLETLVERGIIDWSDIKVLNKREDAGFKPVHSTRLYPEWPFAMVAGTDDDLAKQVLKALLDMPSDSEAARAAGITGWTVPLDYEPVRALMKELEVGPFQHPESLGHLLAEHWREALLPALLLLSLISLFVLITNRRLSRQRTAYQSLVSSLPSAVYRCRADQKRTLEFVSEPVASISGHSVEELLGDSRHGLSELIDPAERETVAEQINQALQASDTYVVEYRMLRPNGERRWVVDRAKLGKGVVGQPRELHGVITDVTDSRRLEASVRDSNRRYKTLFESAADAIFLMHGDRFIDCNSRTLEIFGCSRDQIIGQPPYQFSPQLQPDGRGSREKSLEMIQAAFRGERPTFEWKHCRYDGKPFDAEVSLAKLELGGEPHLLALVRDISERKKADHALRASREELQRRNEALELINDVSARLHRSLRISDIADQAVKALTGIGRAPFIAFYLFDELSMTFELAASHGIDKQGRQAISSLSMTEGASSESFSGEGLIHCERIKPGCCCSPFSLEPFIRLQVTSAILIPVFYERQLLAVVNLMFLTKRQLQNEELATLEALGSTVGLALANAKHVGRMQQEIHERELAEKELGETEEQYLELIEKIRNDEDNYSAFVANSSEAIYRVDFIPPIRTDLPLMEQVELIVERSVMAECNLAFARMYGRAVPEDLVDSRMEEIGLPVRSEAELFVLADYSLQDHEMVHRDERGRPVWIAFTVQGDVKDGLLTRAWGVQRDITERKVYEEMVFNISAGVSAMTGERFFVSLVRHLVSSLFADHAYIAELMPEDPSRARTIAVFSGSGISDNFEYELVGTPDADVIDGGSRVFVSAVQNRFPNDQRLARFGVEGVVGASLTNAGGVATGVLMVMFREEVASPEKTDTLLGIFAARAAAEIDRQQGQERLEHQAMHDSLTDLPNRSLLHRKTAELIGHRDGRSPMFSMMLIDLDRFKEINDTLGHEIGDQLLKQIGPRLRDVLEPTGATLVRLGGDEFAVLVPTLADPSDIRALAENMLAALRQPFGLEGLNLEIGASIGIALYPTHGLESGALLRCADVAMYVAKHKGGGYEVYDQELDPHSTLRLALIGEMGNAIRDDQLLLHYQPKISIASGDIVGVEALVRWQHPKHGLIMPGQFIPLVELSELIHEITYWVVEHAIVQWCAWRDEGFRTRIAVNISARNLLNQDCLDRVTYYVKKYGVEPGCLEFEITESALIADPGRALKILARLGRIGVEFSIDDFGTGYSSLAYLRRLPLSSLKIDRSFVRPMNESEQDAIIVASTITLAHNLGLLVIAEGVEDKETLDKLRAMGCDIAQGHFLSVPLPAADVHAWGLQRNGQVLPRNATTRAQS
jgi:diguanylate cyclase (GGDEF)-like protein/PAS domain S-box-containing protein